MPRHTKRSQSIPESILMPAGGVETIMLDERYSPYARHVARIENLCGSFGEFVPIQGLERVMHKTGTQRELFHLHGNVVVNQAGSPLLSTPMRKRVTLAAGRGRAPSWPRGAWTAWPGCRAR